MKIEDYLKEDEKEPSFSTLGKVIIVLLCVAGWVLIGWGIYVIYNFATS